MLGTAKKRALTTAGAVLGVVLVSGATAAASVPSSSGTIYGCYAKTNGATRIIDPARQKCGSTENPISWNQRGPRGPQGPKGDTGAPGTPGTPGTAGVSGYEVVTKEFGDVPLPIDTFFEADCPTGKKVFGGGGLAQLWNGSTFIDHGVAPLYSIPDGDTSWSVYTRQAATGGATTANVSVYAICAIAGP